MTNETPAYLKLLRRPNGATSEELRIAMNRVYGPTKYQLAPIADRLGFKLTANRADGDVTRYRFETKEAKGAKKTTAKSTKPAKKPAMKIAA